MRPSRSPERIEAAPDDFTGGNQRIEVGRGVAGDAGGEDLRFEQRGGKRRALEGFDGVKQCVEAAAFLQDALPLGFETREEAGLGGFDFFA